MARKMSAAAKAREAVLEALYEAQMTYYKVMDAKTAKQAITIAKKALAISPLCADAHVLLAEQAEYGSDEAFGHWQRAVEAGREALGPEFDEFVGEFWSFMETRPYMRARFGLACALWERGMRDEAIDHLHAMLELNPNDNQGVRYVLACWLLETARDDALNVLLERYREDEMAAWLWTWALAAFRREGDGKESRKRLAKALKQNPHVARYLVGDRPLPEVMPAFHGFGDDNEAVCYLDDGLAGWTLTPGAIDWVRARNGASAPARTKAASGTSAPKARKRKPAEAGAASAA